MYIESKIFFYDCVEAAFLEGNVTRQLNEIWHRNLPNN